MDSKVLAKKWWHNAVCIKFTHAASAMPIMMVSVISPGIISKLIIYSNWGSTSSGYPVYKSPMDDNGYDISDYQDIAAEFGTLAEMENLIAEAKQRDIQIVMDLVVNHTSDEHPWFVEAKIQRQPTGIITSGASHKLTALYRTISTPTSVVAAGSLMKPLANILHQFSKRQPDLNWENPKSAGRSAQNDELVAG